MKTRRWPGRRGPTTASAPSTNAVSLETTTPHAPAWGVADMIVKKSRAGTASPATAARTGTVARERMLSSPTANSFFTSRPTTKKKNVMRMSFTIWRRSNSTLNAGDSSRITDRQNVSYDVPSPTFAQMRAAIVPARSRAADVFSTFEMPRRWTRMRRSAGNRGGASPSVVSATLSAADRFVSRSTGTPLAGRTSRRTCASARRRCAPSRI